MKLEKLEEFLRQEFAQIIRKRKDQLRPLMDISEQDIVYLISLLVQYAEAEKFKSDFTNTPLFDLAQKRKVASHQQINGLADFCLFRVGFFPFAFNQRHIPPRNNFIMAGKTAYFDLSRFQHPALIFLSLSKNFLLFANLISEFKLKYLADVEIMELWDFWEETGNLFAEEQLRKMNVSLKHSCYM